MGRGELRIKCDCQGQTPRYALSGSRIHSATKCQGVLLHDPSLMDASIDEQIVIPISAPWYPSTAMKGIEPANHIIASRLPSSPNNAL